MSMLQGQRQTRGYGVTADGSGNRCCAAHPAAERQPHVWVGERPGYIITRWPRTMKGRRLGRRIVLRERLITAELEELEEVEELLRTVAGRNALPPYAWIYRLEGVVSAFWPETSWVQRRLANYVTVQVAPIVAGEGGGLIHGRDTSGRLVPW
jgi:hypothetical protein